MKAIKLSFAILGLAVAQMAMAKADVDLKTDQQKLSYAFGYEMGSNFNHEKISIEPDTLIQGLKAALSQQTPAMTDKEIQDTLMNFQKQIIAKRAQEFTATAEKNAKEGEAFLKANQTKSDVVTLPNGLQYKVIDAGNGATPTATDTVTVDYEGQNLAGDVFDSSYKRGKPTSFKVNEVIPAWSEALQKMKVGATWMVYAPPSLAYGKTGLGGPIGPEQTLVFKIHLLAIGDQTKPATDGKTADATGAAPNAAAVNGSKS